MVPLTEFKVRFVNLFTFSKHLLMTLIICNSRVPPWTGSFQANASLIDLPRCLLKGSVAHNLRTNPAEYFLSILPPSARLSNFACIAL